MARRQPRRVSPTPDLSEVSDRDSLLAWLGKSYAAWEPRISYRRLTERVNELARAAHRPATGTTTVYDLLAPVKGRRSRVDWELVVDLAVALGAEEPVVYQLRQIVTALSDATGPPVPVDVATVIPDPDPHFTGREAELSRIVEVWASVEPLAVPPVVLVDGPPGIGKSALAVAAAHRVLERAGTAVRQLYVDLHGAQPGRRAPGPEAVLEHLLHQAGLAYEHAFDKRGGFEAKSDRFRRTMTAKPTILVLDNAPDFEQVRPLLPAVPGCLVLVTSRHRRGDPRLAYPVSLGPLPGAEATGLLRRHAPERVDADPGTARYLAERLCFGHPYHLKVLAGMVTDAAKADWSLADIAKLVERQPADDASLRLLTASFESGLPDPARSVFCLLGLLAGHGFAAHDAAALAGIDLEPARERLRQLHDRNLLRLNDSRLGRYAMHAITAAFARRMLNQTVPHSAQEAALDRLYRTDTHILPPSADRDVP